MAKQELLLELPERSEAEAGEAGKPERRAKVKSIDRRQSFQVPLDVERGRGGAQGASDLGADREAGPEPV
jgi:hypothetical protein